MPTKPSRLAAAAADGVASQHHTRTLCAEVSARSLAGRLAREVNNGFLHYVISIIGPSQPIVGQARTPAYQLTSICPLFVCCEAC